MGRMIMRNITIADVAKHAKVSKSTISQFLNKRYEYMSEKTRKRIEESIRILDYKPNIVARSLKQKATFTIGVVVANILHNFSTQVIRAIENYYYEQGFHIIVCNADDNPEKEKNYIEMLRAKQVDGIIIFPTGDNLALYRKMKEDEFPIVFMDRTIEELDIATVILDNKLAAKLAVDHFVEKGYTNISIITTSIIRNITPRIERIQGYKEALIAHGIPLNPSYIRTSEQAEIQASLSQMYQLKTPPQAILAANDIVLHEVLRFVKKQNLRIPEDIALISIDDVPFASFYTPTITAIKQPSVEMGRFSSELLLYQIKKERVKNSIYRMVPELVVRTSC
jgi:LacI family transcriptional regulator, kdg operon repressor